MNTRFMFGFAMKNLKVNKFLEIPFIISSGIMLILLNVMASLLQNKYVVTRHSSLSMFIAFGVFVSCIFTFVFVIYANRFLIKRRNKEFALYGVLGLEKKHIRRIIFIENFVLYSLLAVISEAGGFVFGKLAFLGLNRLLADKMGNSMDYPFSVTGMKVTLIYIAFLFIVIYLTNAVIIGKATPSELFGMAHKGEGEPKNRIMLLLVGMTLLTGGYGIAITVQGTLKSLLFFFIAVVLVIGATYSLFVSLSVFILKRRKNNKKFYYKPDNFLSVSGMLYRMKSSAIGLASITILSTGVIIALSATLAIYANIETAINTTVNRDLSIESLTPITSENYGEVKGQLYELIKSSVKNEKNISDMFIDVGTLINANKKGDKFERIRKNDSEIEAVFILTGTLDAYNREFGKNETLEDGEILISSNTERYLDIDGMNLAEKDYKIRKIENILPGNFGLEGYKIIVKDFKTLTEFAEYYDVLIRDGDREAYTASPIYMSMDFNVNGEDKNEVTGNLLNAEDKIVITSKQRISEDIYGLNGGFLFLGIVVGILFLSGTILIIYYKQLTEGLEDRENYKIMKRVGLPDKLIKRTASSQVLWLLFMPLIAALVHSFVASKIVYQLLCLFGLYTYMQYGSMLLIVAAVFAVVYFINFKITSNAYYKCVR